MTANLMSATRVVRRTLTVRFNRPYAAVAVAVTPAGPRSLGRLSAGRRSAAVIDNEASTGATRFALPVFSAWVAEPTETPKPPPDRSPFGH
jgi:hypothetical protein